MYARGRPAGAGGGEHSEGRHVEGRGFPLYECRTESDAKGSPARPAKACLPPAASFGVRTDPVRRRMSLDRSQGEWRIAPPVPFVSVLAGSPLLLPLSRTTLPLAPNDLLFEPRTSRLGG